MKKNTKLIVMNAMIACIYAVLTIAIAPIAYGELQMRLSEMMIFLAFYNKNYIPGLVAGCFLANLASPLGMFDVVFGTFATLLAVIAMYKVNNKYLGAFCGAVFNGIIVGYELHLAFEIPFLINAVYVFIGEFAVLVLGAVLFTWLEKNKSFMNKFITNY